MIKLILNVLGAFITISFIWASFWILCLANDHCYYNNIGVF